MVKAKTRMDPSGVRRVLDVGGPSNPKAKNKKTLNKASESDFLEDKAITTSTILRKKPRHQLRSPIKNNDLSSSSDELSSIWGLASLPEPAPNRTKTPEITSQPLSSPISPPRAQKLTVTADIHCSQGGSKATKLPNTQAQAKKADSVSAQPTTQPSADLNNISEDKDFIVQVSRKNRKNPSKPSTVTVSEEAVTTSLPLSPTSQPQNQAHATPQNAPQTPSRAYLTAPPDKIPPVVIHHHFDGDMTRLNKEFHSKFQPLGFTVYRIKAGIACQTSTLNDYVNHQRFLKENKVPFNLPQSKSVKPY
jgi:hypothetical protein